MLCQIQKWLDTTMQTARTVCRKMVMCGTPLMIAVCTASADTPKSAESQRPAGFGTVVAPDVSADNPQALRKRLSESVAAAMVAMSPIDELKPEEQQRELHRAADGFDTASDVAAGLSRCEEKAAEGLKRTHEKLERANGDQLENLAGFNKSVASSEEQYKAACNDRDQARNETREDPDSHTKRMLAKQKWVVAHDLEQMLREMQGLQRTIMNPAIQVQVKLARMKGQIQLHLTRRDMLKGASKSYAASAAAARAMAEEVGVAVALGPDMPVNLDGIPEIAGGVKLSDQEEREFEQWLAGDLTAAAK